MPPQNSRRRRNQLFTILISQGYLKEHFKLHCKFRSSFSFSFSTFSTSSNDDQTLEERTSIPVAQVMQLPELCLRSTYFQFENQFYKQTDGAAMGSPLLPIITNLFMEYIEEKAITTALLKPSLWIRYVDDTFDIWPHGSAPLKIFHEHLNQQCPSIQFTIKTEDNGKIPFLDVLITQNGTQLSTLVYRKATHFDRYLPFHPTTTRGCSQV